MAAEYPMPVFHFRVDWDGNEFEFSEASGFNLEAQMLEYRPGNSKEYFTTKMPGLQKTSDISLKRGIFKGRKQFYEWFDSIQLNKVDRKNITISLLDETHEPVVTWKVVEAWPMKIENPNLKGDGNEIAIESMTIVHEGLSVDFS
jgi:phage tail-like protein